MSRIVNRSKLGKRITIWSISLLALLTALGLGCNGRSSQKEPTAAASVAAEQRSSGAEHELPEPQSYAHQLDDPARDEWQKPEEVVELLDCRPGMTVVDLGAGTGYFIGYLSQAVGPRGRVLALDTEGSMLTAIYARIEKEGLQNVKPDRIPPENPMLGRRSVDRVLVVNTWHHITDRVAYAKKLRNALRGEGLVLIVDFTMDSPHGPPAAVRLSDDTVVGELEAAGFSAEVLEESLPYQYVVAGRVP